MLIETDDHRGDAAPTAATDPDGVDAGARGDAARPSWPTGCSPWWSARTATAGTRSTTSTADRSSAGPPGNRP